MMWCGGEEEEEGGNFLHGFILGYIWVVIEAHNKSVALLSSYSVGTRIRIKLRVWGGERTLLYAALGKRNVAGEKDVAASEP